jgi:hypothetical protein
MKVTNTMRRTTPVVLFFAMLVVACAAPQPPAPPATALPPTIAAAPTSVPIAATAAPVVTVAPKATATLDQLSDDDIRAGIQGALDTYTKAYNTNDPELLKQAVDQTNLPFRRLVQGRFETFQQSISAGQITFGFQVNSIQRRDLGFIQAQIISDGGSALDWLFRQVNGRWVLSEPTEDQIGKRQKTEDSGFVFSTYPWGDDVNPTIIKLMKEARDTVKSRLGKVSEKPVDVLIKPIFGLPPPESSNVLAYYVRNSRPGLPARIVVYAPHSYAFGSYDPAKGWEADLLATLTHEYTHLTNDQLFTPIARMSDWMYEGLAEFISDPEAPLGRGVPFAVQQNQIIPIADPSDRVDKQDLQHIYTLEKDVSLAYGLANTMVAYTVEKHGGIDGFWKLVQAYDRLQNLDQALQETYDINLETFDSGWREWLKQKYG